MGRRAARENGIKFESEKEKHDAVGRALQELGVGGKDATMAERWEAAKSLPDSFGNKGQSFSLENVFGDKYTEVADTAVAKADVEAGPALTGNDIPSAQAKELFSPDINITLEGKNGAELTADMVKENPLYDYYLEAATDMGMTPDQALAELIEGLDIANLYEDAGAKFNENGDVVVPSTMVSGKAVVDPNFAASFNEMVARQVAEEIAKQTKANA